MVNKGGCLKGRVKETPNGGCKIGRKNNMDKPKRKVTGAGKKMMIEIDGKAKPKRKAPASKPKAVKKATHKMSDGTIHTGKKHTKDSKVVKKAPAKRVSKPKTVRPSAKPKRKAKPVGTVDMSKASMCGRAPLTQKAMIKPNPRRPKVGGIRKIKINRMDGSKEVRRYDMGVPAGPLRMMSSTVMNQPDNILSGTLANLSIPPVATTMRKKTKRRMYA